MIYGLRRILITLLTLLQLVTPLVHAHAGEHDSHGGFHIPELEFFNIDSEEPTLQTAFSHSMSKGMIIGVSSGMKFNTILLDSPENLVIDTVKKYFISKKTLKEINFFPQPPVPFSQTFHRPSIPRAPPA